MTTSSDSSRKRKLVRSNGVDVRPSSGSKKDTKRWCRGKKDVPHQPECRFYNDLKSGIGDNGEYTKNWRVLVCAECGKELDRYWPMEMRVHSKDGTVTVRPPEPPPSWVRAHEKRLSRERDEADLASGKKTREQLRAENGLFAFPDSEIDLASAKKLY